MGHKCDRPRRAPTKRATFRARSRGRGYDVINPNKVLEKMAEVRARPSPSLLARLSMMQQHHPVFRTYYVHKSMADGSLYWSSDDRTAERFGTAQEALAFARTHLDGGIRVAEHRLWNGCDGPPPP